MNQNLETPEEKAKRIGVPLIQKLPQPPNQFGITGVCGECGREIGATDSYWCGNQRCPVQLKVTC